MKLARVDGYRLDFPSMFSCLSAVVLALRAISHDSVYSFAMLGNAVKKVLYVCVRFRTWTIFINDAGCGGVQERQNWLDAGLVMPPGNTIGHDQARVPIGQQVQATQADVNRNTSWGASCIAQEYCSRHTLHGEIRAENSEVPRFGVVFQGSDVSSVNSAGFLQQWFKKLGTLTSRFRRPALPPEQCMPQSAAKKCL